MEDVNNWLSFYMSNESINHEFAIRRFFPARMEQEPAAELVETYQLCSSDDATSTHPCLASSSEVDDFVESIINMDQYEYDHEDLEKHQSLDDHSVVNDEEDENHHHEFDAYSMVNGVYGYDPMTMEYEEQEMSGGSYDAMPEIEPIVEEDSTTLGMNQGLDLIHMLLACAEAVGCRDTQQAEFLLSRIRAIVDPFGNSLQRVSHCFAAALKCRLLSLLPHNNALPNDVPNLVTRDNKLEAFEALCQTTPYIALGFMAANDAICQSSHGKTSIHIIDLGMEHTLQWPSLLRSLVSKPEGPPRIRITELIGGNDNARIQAGMVVLVEEASSLGITLEFQLISEPASPTLLTKENLKLREGEALFVNSILQLHKYVKESRGYMKEILQSIKKLGPVSFTVVEQDTNHNGPFFLGRFLESLHYYSAIFDSLEEIMPRNSRQRMKIEGVHFAEEIRNIVACEGTDRMERHDRVEKWRRQLGRVGFQVMPLKCTSQARMLLSVYDCDGYTLCSEKDCLLLGWKGRPIMMASAWQVASL